MEGPRGTELTALGPARPKTMSWALIAPLIKKIGSIGLHV